MSADRVAPAFALLPACTPVCQPLDRRRHRGMAVISALLVVAAAAVIAAGMLERQSMQLRSLQSERARVQARALLVGGMDWARVILRADARRQATTRGDQMWATPIANLQVSEDGDDDAGLFSGRIEDALGKFNLQNLAVNGEPDDDAVAALTRLLQSLGMDTQPVQGIVQRLAMAQARRLPPDHQGTGGAAASRQAAATANASSDGAAGTASAPGIQMLTGLRTYGWDDAALTALQPYLTILPVRTPINVNTVTAEVLAAIVPDVSLAQARAVIDQRDRGQYFNNTADFTNRLNDPDLTVAASLLTVNSAWFSVTGAVDMGPTRVEMQALLRRDGEAVPTIVWMAETR